MQRRTSKKCTKALLYTKIFCVSLGYWEWGKKLGLWQKIGKTQRTKKSILCFQVSKKKKCFLKKKKSRLLCAMFAQCVDLRLVSSGT